MLYDVVRVLCGVWSLPCAVCWLLYVVRCVLFVACYVRDVFLLCGVICCLLCVRFMLPVVDYSAFVVCWVMCVVTCGAFGV